MLGDVLRVACEALVYRTLADACKALLGPRGANLRPPLMVPGTPLVETDLHAATLLSIVLLNIVSHSGDNRT